MRSWGTPRAASCKRGRMDAADQSHRTTSRGALLRVMAVAACAATCVLVVQTPAARAYDRHADLERVASSSRSGRRGSLPLDRRVDRRPDLGHRAKSFASLGLHGHGRRVHRAPPRAVCRGGSGSDPAIPAWQRATGVLVLVHEAYHLRRWTGRRARRKSSARRSATSRSPRERSARPPARERAASLCARRTRAHGQALPGVSRQKLQASALETAVHAVKSVRSACGRRSRASTARATAVRAS